MTTIGSPVEQLDLATVVEVSQALSGEIILEKLFDTLMVIALEHAGAERGLLILARGDELRIAAEATTTRCDTVEVRLRQACVTSAEMPESVLRYVTRTQDIALLDDASVPNPFSADPYIGRKRSRSVLCLPLMKQARLIGVLYLENNLMPRVFTPARIGVLKLLASQAAISLENARLYGDLERENIQRKRAEEAVRAGKTRFEGILEIAEEAIISVDSSQRIVLFNLGAERIFGYAQAEIIGSPLELLLPQGFADVHRDHIEEVVRSPDVARSMGRRREVSGRRKDGHEFPAEASISKLDLDGEVVFTVILRDITERKKTMEDLRRSEAYLAEAQRLSLTGSFGWKVSSGELVWSAETYCILAYERDTKPTLALVFERVHPEDITLVQRTLDRVSRDATNLDFEHRLLMPDGAVKHVHVVARPVRDESGELEFVGAVMDVTAAKQSQRALENVLQEMQVLKDQLRLAVDTIPGLVWSALPDGCIDFLNQRWREYTGLTLEEASGWGWEVAIHPADLSGLVDYWRAVLASGKPGEAEARLRRFDGEYRWFLFRAVPLYDELGNLVKWYGTNTDIQARKGAEALLAGEKRLLEMVAKGNPLSVVLDALCRLVEEMASGALCSILLVEPNGRQLSHGAAPSLPPSYTQAIDESAIIALKRGPCTSAAFLKEPVIASDFASDERWPESYRARALAHGLRACWSTPMLSRDGTVLGTFALYYREPGSPSLQQQEIIEQFTHIASIAVERARAEEALKRSEERYALVMAATGEGYWDWIIATDAYYASPRMLEMYGFPPDTVFASRSEFLASFPFHPEDRPKWEQAVAAHFAGDTERFEIEIRMILRGETRWIHLTGLCLRDASGTPVRWTGAVADVTERKCAELALRRSEERYALAVDAAGDGHTDWIVATDEFYASPRFLEMCGLPADTTFKGRMDFVNRFPFHPEDRDRVVQAMTAHFAGKTVRLEMEMRMIVRGETRWVHLTGLCSRDASGALVRWNGALTDMTERRRAEELERQLRQAQRLEAMGTLAGGIAHDFNNILGAILGYGEMALRDAPRGSRLRRDVDSIMTAGERGRALVERILAFSRSGVGERVAVHVEEVVREALDLLAAKLPENVTIEARLRAGRAAMLGDPTQVHQVLMNLATNAIQAMTSGGTLRVSLDAVHLDAPHVATTATIAAGEYIVLEVADCGTGIPREIMDQIFDPFFTTKEVGVGTGLGLSLVHGIVTEVGGAIDVTSTVGTVSVFTVYLPHTGEAADDGEGEAPALPRGDREQVLIVDDEEALVRLATETLAELGYVPVGFTSSVAALEAFRAHPERFNAVITDERMPGLSGSALIREVRAIRSTIPILLVSGYLGAAVVQRARDAGADAVLNKPLSARELATSLAQVLHPQ